MKTSDNFKKTIESYLQKHAEQNPRFKQRFELKDKNINDCITYILNEVKKSGCNGFEDDEVYNMAKYYYIADKIDVGSKVSGSVIVNHSADNKKELNPWSIAQSEKAYLMREIDENYTNEGLVNSFREDLTNLNKEPLKYWKSLPIDNYKTDPDNQGRYEEVKFMLDHYEKKNKPVSTPNPKANKRATNGKPKPKPTKIETPVLEPVYAEDKPQLSLF